MKKLLLMIVLFLFPFSVVNASELKLNKLTIEGEEIELQDNIYEYDINLNTEYSNISVYAVVDDGISYKVIGNNNIVAGNNVVTIDVTDGLSKKQYVINILKKDDNVIILSNNNKLKNLSISGYPLGFDPDKLEYNLTIGAEAKLRINCQAESDKAEVYVYGNEGLVDGSIIRVKVVSESGDIREYKINIKATEVREEIEVYEEEKYDKQLIAYVVSALLIVIFLVIINLSNKDEKK